MVVYAAGARFRTMADSYSLLGGTPVTTISVSSSPGSVVTVLAVNLRAPISRPGTSKAHLKEAVVSPVSRPSVVINIRPIVCASPSPTTVVIVPDVHSVRRIKTATTIRRNPTRKGIEPKSPVCRIDIADLIVVVPTVADVISRWKILANTAKGRRPAKGPMIDRPVAPVLILRKQHAHIVRSGGRRCERRVHADIGKLVTSIELTERVIAKYVAGNSAAGVRARRRPKLHF
jgi:hypothetical protein